jgi:hypothetical protein
MLSSISRKPAASRYRSARTIRVGGAERAEVAAEHAAGQGGQRAVQVLKVSRELTEFGLLKEHGAGQAAAAEGGRDQVEFAARGGRQVAGRDAPLGRLLQVEPGQLIVRHGRA